MFFVRRWELILVVGLAVGHFLALEAIAVEIGNPLFSALSQRKSARE